MTTNQTTAYTVHRPGATVPVELTVEETGTGHPVLLLHGGAGPASVLPWASLLATQRPARVLGA
jgi:pimeloyl-ACP methyl ester carboxylesterase